jgi:hypothetical protein
VFPILRGQADVSGFRIETAAGETTPLPAPMQRARSPGRGGPVRLLPLVFERLQDFGYTSYIWQPVVAITAVAVRAPRARNAELFIALIVSILLTLAIATSAPAFVPADTRGLVTPHVPVIQALRARLAGRTCPISGLSAFRCVVSSWPGIFWWAVTDSNRRPSRCKRDALPLS